MIRYLRGEAGPTPRPALFLDRDGVLNRHIVDGYVTEPREFEPLDIALGAASAAQDMSIALVVITNQGVIGRELATESDVMAIHALLLDVLAEHGITLDAIYACPHHPKAPDPAQRLCECRKPKPGMILAAARDLNLDVTASVFIGDQPSDVAAAKAAGIPDDRILVIGAAGADLTSFVKSAFAPFQ